MTAMELVQRQGIDERHRRQHEWVDRQAGEDRAWQEAVSFNETTTRMTSEELKALVLAVADVVEEHVQRAKTARADETGTRMVKVYGQFFPLPPE